ncbi:MAG: phosphopantetheine-binding protein [Fischerella sp.]|nr:phosphopantetheine-binding protein [Fischerella sp.]
MHELVTDDRGKPWICTRTGENISTLAETSVDFVRTCCKSAAAAAGVTLADIDFFAFNTPTAWYANVCVQALGISSKRTINLYPRYANIGAVLPIANLYHAAHAGKIREDSLVLVYTKGAAATAAAVVMRWGDVGLGTVPVPPVSVTQEQEKIHFTGVNCLLTEKSSISTEKLLSVAPEQQRQMLETYLMEWLSHSLQLPLSEIDRQQPFALLLDSLMAFLLKTKVENDLGVQVSMEKFFGDNNIAQLVELLLNKLVLVKVMASESRIMADAEEREKLSL